MNPIPMEVSFGGVYLAPVLLATLVGVFAAWLITRILNWLDMARYVWYPPLFFLALSIICVGLVGRFLIPF